VAGVIVGENQAGSDQWSADQNQENASESNGIGGEVDSGG
jgi:hypothetical protein